ncbi:MAG: twin-arginine translocase TatA/TatE family subunit [Spirochaetaceae bacterium]|nr:twin-arginine translocase TatA/TatE family subunit [Spirochaetaceae bacterium]
MIPGGAEWIIIGGVVLVLFGASAIPRFARSIGRAKKEFEKGQRDGARQAEGERNGEEAPAADDSDERPSG